MKTGMILLCALLLVSCGKSATQSHFSQREIRNGELVTAEDSISRAVFSLWHSTTGRIFYFACTATIIKLTLPVGPQLPGADPVATGTALTAKHCIAPGYYSRLYSSDRSTALSVSTAIVDPLLDVATVQFSGPTSKLTNIVPAQIATTLPKRRNAVVGIGFGENEGGVFAKRIGTFKVKSVSTASIVVESGSSGQIPCSGDSGSALFFAGKIIGVVSTGVDSRGNATTCSNMAKVTYANLKNVNWLMR